MDVLTDIYITVKNRNIDKFKNYLNIKFILIYYEYERLESKIREWWESTGDSDVHHMYTLLVQARKMKIEKVRDTFFQRRDAFEPIMSDYYLDIVTEYTDVLVKYPNTMILSAFENFLDRNRILLNMDNFYENIYNAECRKHRREMPEEYYCVEYAGYNELSLSYKTEFIQHIHDTYGSTYLKYVRQMQYHTVCVTEKDELLPVLYQAPSNTYIEYKRRCCGLF